MLVRISPDTAWRLSHAHAWLAHPAFSAENAHTPTAHKFGPRRWSAYQTENASRLEALRRNCIQP